MALRHHTLDGIHEPSALATATCRVAGSCRAGAGSGSICRRRRGAVLADSSLGWGCRIEATLACGSGSCGARLWLRSLGLISCGVRVGGGIKGSLSCGGVLVASWRTSVGSVVVFGSHFRKDVRGGRLSDMVYDGC